MIRRHLQLITPLILLVYLLAQNGLVLAQLTAVLSGHQVASKWHDSHYDVVMFHGVDHASVVADDGCQVSCSDHHHLDIKPSDPVTPDSKTFLGFMLALIPVFLVWLLPFARFQLIRLPRLRLHRNTLPLLIRSTVLRH